MTVRDDGWWFKIGGGTSNDGLSIMEMELETHSSVVVVAASDENLHAPSTSTEYDDPLFFVTLAESHLRNGLAALLAVCLSFSVGNKKEGCGVWLDNRRRTRERVLCFPENGRCTRRSRTKREELWDHSLWNHCEIGEAWSEVIIHFEKKNACSDDPTWNVSCNAPEV